MTQVDPAAMRVQPSATVSGRYVLRSANRGPTSRKLTVEPNRATES